MIKADYHPLYTYYGIEHNPSVEDIEKSVEGYIRFLDAYGI